MGTPVGVADIVRARTDEQGFAVLTAEDFDDDLRAAAQQAVLDCPEAALSIPD